MYHLRKVSALGPALLFLTALAGCMKGKTETSPNPEPIPATASRASQPGGEPKKPPVDLTKAKPDFTLTAEQFYADVRREPQKYQGKLIELSGLIACFATVVENQELTWWGIALGRNTTGGGVFATVYFPRAGPPPWTRVCPGQTVKVRGTHRSGNRIEDAPHLEDAVLVEAGPSPAVVISAEQLAKEYGQDMERTTRRYALKPLLIEGDIIDTRGYIVLKGDGKIHVACSGFGAGGMPKEPLKVGQRVTVLVLSWNGFRGGPDRAGEAEECYVVEVIKRKG